MPPRLLEAGQPQGEFVPANAFQKGDRKPWKGKGKGKGKGDKGGDGKGKGGQANLNAASPGAQVVGSQSFSGCFICGSKQHYARNCPKNTASLKAQTPVPAAAITTLCCLCVETPNPFGPLREDIEEEPDEEEELSSTCSIPAPSPGAGAGKSGPGSRPVRRWSRSKKAKRSDDRRNLDREPEAGTTPGSDPVLGERGEAEDDVAMSTGALLVITTDSINGLENAAEEWEEVEFMVDSGAGATVVGPDAVKAVQASEPDPSRNYKLADGILTQDRGKKSFNAQAQDESWWNLNARVTDVDKPLLSVSQMVEGGSTAVFAPGGSYIKFPKGTKMPIELRSNVYFLKMWVQKNQKTPFQGQA